MSNADYPSPSEQQRQDEHISSSLTSHDVNIGAYHVGTVYARALVDAAEKAGKTEEVMAEFDALINELLIAHPQVTEFLSSEMISLDVRRRVMLRLIEGRFSPLFVNFCQVVVEHRRGQCLQAIHRAAHDLVDELRGRVRVQVTSATPLDGAARTEIINQLRAKLGAEPVLESRVDQALIGGAVFRVGDTVYDGSVATRLRRLRSQMINRSVHEIQSRRDRFSSAAGN